MRSSQIILGSNCCYFAPDRGAKCCDQRCLYVCVCMLPVCPRAYLKNQLSKLHQIFRACCLWRCSRSSSGGVTMCYVLPVLWLTSRFHVMARQKRSEKGIMLWLTRRQHRRPRLMSKIACHRRNTCMWIDDVTAVLILGIISVLQRVCVGIVVCIVFCC